MSITINQSKVYDVPSNYTFTIRDSSKFKTVHAAIDATAIPPILLWSGEAYAAAGDYTQAQVSTAVASYLASVANPIVPIPTTSINITPTDISTI